MKLHPAHMLLIVCGALLAGVGLASLYNPSSQMLFGGLLLFICVAVFASRKPKVGAVILLAGLAFLVGIWRFVQVWQAPSLMGEYAQAVGSKAEVEITGHVDGDFSVTETGRGRFPFWVEAIKANGQPLPVNERVMVITNNFPSYHYGQELSVSGKLMIPEPIEDFDYPGYLKMQGIRVLVQAQGVPTDMHTMGGSSVILALMQVRDRFLSAMRQAIPEPAGGYVAGVLLGIRTDIAKAMQDAFARTGTSHILAVSGYNITIIGDSVLRLLVRYIRRQRAVWAAIGIILAFVLLVGLSASVVRAGVMGALLLTAMGIGRVSDAGVSVMVAAALMALANPLILKYDIGFQLSFAAVMGLIYIRPLIAQKFGRLAKSSFGENMITTFAAQIAVLPLLAYHFEMLSTVFLLANALVLPFVPAVMFLGFAAGLAQMFSTITGRAVGFLAWALSMYQLKAVVWMAGIPGSAVHVKISAGMVFVFYVVLIIAITHYRKSLSGFHK